MGGIGSGSWYRHDRKTTVEECLIVAVSHVRTRGGWQLFGGLTWKWNTGQRSLVAYEVATENETPVVTFRYRINGQEDIVLPIGTQATVMPSAKLRWWFTCPLVTNGVPCRRRVSKLHLPPRARYFGCRRCHDLRYRSSQEAHQTERMLRQMGFDADKDLVRIFTSRLRFEGV